MVIENVLVSTEVKVTVVDFGSRVLVCVLMSVSCSTSPGTVTVEVVTYLVTVERVMAVREAVVDRGLSNPRLICLDVGMQLRVVVSNSVSVCVNVELETIVVGSNDSVTVPFPTKAVTVASVVDGSRRGLCSTVVVTV
jgi:hypothetical protein